MILPVSIAAIGARTPVGLTAASCAAAVRGGLGKMEAHPYLVGDRGSAHQQPIAVNGEPCLGSASHLLEPVRRIIEAVLESAEASTRLS